MTGSRRQREFGADRECGGLGSFFSTSGPMRPPGLGRGSLVSISGSRCPQEGRPRCPKGLPQSGASRGMGGASYSRSLAKSTEWGPGAPSWPTCPRVLIGSCHREQSLQSRGRTQHSARSRASISGSLLDHTLLAAADSGRELLPQLPCVLRCWPSQGMPGVLTGTQTRHVGNGLVSARTRTHMPVLPDADGDTSTCSVSVAQLLP